MFDVQQWTDAKQSQTERLNWFQMLDASCSLRIPHAPDWERESAQKKCDKKSARGMWGKQKVDQSVPFRYFPSFYNFFVPRLSLPFIVVYRTLPLWSCCLKSHPQHRSGICPKPPVMHQGTLNLWAFPVSLACWWVIKKNKNNNNKISKLHPQLFKLDLLQRR